MSSEDWFFLGLSIGAAVGLAVAVFAHFATQDWVMQQALARNAAENCIGTAEVHWKGECPEVKP